MADKKAGPKKPKGPEEPQEAEKAVVASIQDVVVSMSNALAGNGLPGDGVNVQRVIKSCKEGMLEVSRAEKLPEELREKAENISVLLGEVCDILKI